MAMAKNDEEGFEDVLKRMHGSNISSFLSPRFQKLICKTTVTNDPDFKCLNTLKFLNWQHLELLLPDERENDSEYFSVCSERLAPCFCAVNSEIRTWLLADFRNFYGEFVKWTGNTKLIEECFLLSLEDGTPLLQALLLLTAVLERALGDVYLLKGKQCPSLLKDLLATTELSELFSPFIIQFLRILIGPPISINIRNVAWHGFLSPKETHQQFCHILLAVIASLGHHLCVNNPSLVNSIPHRSPVKFVVGENGQISSESIVNDITVLRDILSTNQLVAPSMHPVWNHALGLMEKERYGSAMVLILPQLEMSCRLIFTAANGCPQRLLTAESTELFTTFDEMLKRTLPNGDQNRLPLFLGDGIMKCFLDLLIHPEGPRVRDRISHGECDVANFPAHLAGQVLSLCAAIFLKTLPTDLTESEVSAEILTRFDEYQSVYHPIQLLRKEILDVVNCLSTWETCPRPIKEQLDYQNWESTEFDPNKKDWMDVSQVICSMQSEAVITFEVCRPFGDLVGIGNRIKLLQISTLYRNLSSGHQSAASEEEVVGLCRRIMQHCLTVSRQVTEGLKSKYQQWEEKTLRSRQRNTYARMLDCVPEISSGLRCALLLVVVIFMSFAGNVLEAGINKKRIKALKLVLKFIENLVTFTSLDKNRWEEAQKLTCQFYVKLVPLLKSCGESLQ